MATILQFPKQGEKRERLTRDEAIRRIKAALKKRSGRAWSVTGGSGTAWGWITIQVPPKERVWIEEAIPGARPSVLERWSESHRWRKLSAEEHARLGYGYMGPEDCALLAQLLGLSAPVHFQGVHVPDGRSYYQEYVDRAEGREPSVRGQSS
jgi:hypothetical protein